MIIRIEKPLLESMHLFRALPKEDWRKQLTGIIFEADGTVWAANGHVALIARTDKKIDRDVVLSIEKTPAAGKKYQLAIINTEEGICSFIPAFEGIDNATDEECIAQRLAVVKAEEITGGRVIKMEVPVPPDPQPVKGVVFDGDYLTLLSKVADLYGKQEGGKFAIRLTGEHTAALTKIRAGQDYKLSVVLMPIKI